MMQLGIFQDLRMNRRNAVHREAIVDIHMGHMDSLILINDLYLGILIFCLHPLIQLVNDGDELGNHLLQVSIGPFFQRFRKDGMVGVSAGFAHHLNGFIHGECLILHQDADQLRYDHGRMGVVDLDNRMLVQLAQVIMLLPHFL